MATLPSRHLRRQTLIAPCGDTLSEGVIVVSGDGIVVEITGGPPFATVELVAGCTRIGSVTLDQLGSGTTTVTDLQPSNGFRPSGNPACVPVIVRHDDHTMLQGCVSVNHGADSSIRGEA